MMKVDEQTIADYYVNRLNKSKWQVTFRLENGIQVKQLKQFSALGFWSGLVLLPFWGAGLIIWLLAIADYYFQQEKVVFVTTDEMIKQFVKEAK